MIIHDRDIIIHFYAIVIRIILDVVINVVVIA
jgi:hypothetical protein